MKFYAGFLTGMLFAIWVYVQIEKYERELTERSDEERVGKTVPLD